MRTPDSADESFRTMIMQALSATDLEKRLDMGDEFKVYWDLRKPIDSQFQTEKLSIEAEISKAFSDAQHKVEEIEAASRQVNNATMQFVRFFIENKRELPADFLEYVDQWQTENVAKYAEIQIIRDSLASNIRQRQSLFFNLANLYKVSYDKIRDLTVNFSVYLRDSRDKR